VTRAEHVLIMLSNSFRIPFRSIRKNQSSVTSCRAAKS